MEHPTPVKPGLHSAKTVPELLVYIIFSKNLLCFLDQCYYLFSKININIIFVDRKKHTDAIVVSNNPLVAITTAMYVLLSTVEEQN